jgi:hypothetical protein
MGIEWIDKKRMSVRECDITITMKKSSNKRMCANFIFRNDCWEIISDNTKIDFGIDSEKPTRIYFAQGTEGRGYKLCTNGNQKNRYIAISNFDVNDFIGDYNLLFDTKERLYYIDSNNKNGCERDR